MDVLTARSSDASVLVLQPTGDQAPGVSVNISRSGFPAARHLLQDVSDDGVNMTITITAPASQMRNVSDLVQSVVQSPSVRRTLQEAGNTTRLTLVFALLVPHAVHRACFISLKQVAAYWYCKHLASAEDALQCWLCSMQLQSGTCSTASLCCHCSLDCATSIITFSRLARPASITTKADSKVPRFAACFAAALMSLWLMQTLRQMQKHSCTARHHRQHL